MSDIKFTADTLAKAYVKIRTRKQVLKAEFEAKEKELDEAMDTISDELGGMCKTLGADSIKTEHGTIIRSVQERFWTNDWSAFGDFVVENNVPDLFEKRLHQGNTKAWLADNPDKQPPGLNVDRKFVITVRKNAS